ncbi:MAG: PhnD/SsuA/transferrin family substrate-binding protein [Rhodospirillaceae bacterium]|nr:PhnD/SsuA/transferrin family substrate-binding protein [Rhodospirillaceae bacterium]
MVAERSSGWEDFVTSARRQFLLSSLCALGSFAGAIGRCRADGPFSFGLTPVFLDSDIELLHELQAYLGEAMGREVSLVKRRTYQEITALLLSGELDAAWICGFPFVQHTDRLALVAVPLYQNQPLYQSYLIVPADRPVDSWEGLQGDIHAFSDPDSNSGYLVTATLLAQHDLTPARFFAKTFFTYGHRNVIRAVGSGLAQSGSVDGYVWDVMNEREPDLVSRTRVLRRSELLGFPPIACLRTNHASSGIAALTQALIAMAGSERGRKILGILQLDGFSVEPETTFSGIARNYALVQLKGA